MTSLAQPDAAPPRAELQVITFTLGETRYGVEISNVLEVLTLPAITPMMDLPDFVEGIINLRGNIIPVIDLRKRFHLPPRPTATEARVIVAEFAAPGEQWVEVGLIVDAVQQVITFAGEAIEPAPSFIGNIRRAYLSGVGKLPDGLLVVLLDLAKILSAAEQAVLGGTPPSA